MTLNFTLDLIPSRDYSTSYRYSPFFPSIFVKIIETDVFPRPIHQFSVSPDAVFPMRGRSQVLFLFWNPVECLFRSSCVSHTLQMTKPT